MDSSNKNNSAIAELNQRIAACSACPLADNYHLPVPGVGAVPADLLLCAEAPGETEASPLVHKGQFGVPLIGKAGHALQLLMVECGFANVSTHVTNVVLHRPPQNRPPTEDEKSTCSHFLTSRLNLVKPKVIVALGKHAIDSFAARAGVALSSKESSRGKTFVLNEHNFSAKVYCTYHPSYALLRNPAMGKFLREDLMAVRQYLTEVT